MIHAYRLAFTDALATAFRPRGAEGRWNRRGTVVVYAAEHPALAALEMLTAWQAYEDFASYHLFRCDLDANAVHDAVPEAIDGRLDARDRTETQRYGDAWIRARSSVALRVPSVVATASHDVLLNPNHPDFDATTRRVHLGPFRYDPRLLDLLARAKESPPDGP